MNLGFPEMLFLCVLVLLVFGPRKLPEFAKQVGRAVGELKRAKDQVQSQFESEIASLETDTKDAVPEVLTVASALTVGPRKTVTRIITGNLLSDAASTQADAGLAGAVVAEQAAQTKSSVAEQ